MSVAHRSSPEDDPEAGIGRWTRFLLLGLIYIAGVVGVRVLDQRADDSRRAQLVLESLKATTHGFDAVESRVMEHGLVTSVEVEQLGTLRGQMRDGLSELSEIAPDQLPLQNLERAYARFWEALAEQLRLVEQGNLESASAQEEHLAEPLWTELITAVQRAAEAYGTIAEEANVVADAGTVAMLALGIAASWWFIRKLEHERRLADRLNAERAALHASEDRFRTLARDVSDVFLITDLDGIPEYLSPAVEHTWGYPPGKLDGTSVTSLIHPDDQAAARDLLSQVGQAPGGRVKSEVRVQYADDSWHECEVIGSNLLADPGVGGIVLTFHDISDRKSYEQELSRLAFYDPLSGLPNRALFRERLSAALVRSMRWRRSVAVMQLDLDGFKVVNDSLGHDAGDDLLVTVGQRLADCIRAGDTVARLGGDDFTILLEDISGADDAIVVAERVLEAIKRPIEIEGRELFISGSVGIATSGPGLDNVDTLLRNAELAMYRAKTAGRARYEVFDPSMNESALERLELESDLHGALERSEFRLLYQPVVSLSTGVIAEVEALIRWEHPRRGIIPPIQFISICEDLGLIVPIGRWVLEQACLQARQWHDQYPINPPLLVSVNLSPREFLEPTLIPDIARILDRTKLDPGCLRIEITEGMLMENANAVAANLAGLRELGIQMAIDDFGTGYSSLSYLKRLPVNTLKIDRAFVEGLGDVHSTAIVRSLIDLARSLNLVVTGEGIETAEQLHELQKLGCDFGQGYYFSRPVSASEIVRFLSAAQKVGEKPADSNRGAA